ncbi:hypothetical protein DK847_14650 [Aestuariivirga litoralis]|uniref:Uncharacterized protein n=1 Tax=Aestuariivirga litoralis TaxID=2650924 RepID=A0A2W2ALZ2_9HYPH|nr:hypothetical protein [Aestuariivirga litoralis]PZF76411.1 hypothetical protein DK847_14650 [Aestuariivirga litoralis]
MSELALLGNIRPEECLARLQSRNSNFLSDLLHRINAREDLSFTWYTPVPRLQQALEANRRNLDALPDEADIEQLLEPVRKALSTCSEKAVRRYAAQLIGSFPNASLTDPETYMAALVFDLLDCKIPDAILLLTCQEIRRTSRFVPTISEVLQMAQRYSDQWHEILAIPSALPRTRERLQYAVRCAEQTLEHVLEHGHKPPEGTRA